MSRNRTTLRYVWEVVDNEGFDYAFRNYSDFKEVTDEKFQDLRKAYVDAANALSTYVGCDDEDKYGGEEDDD